ncbi:tRNA pseudouridine(55) synthase TruB [Sinanaerobacter chloroacetimidivorans]|uniref:tRNA pseudouridine synthase B n=1 Tax=Sinanaerobacter chloroacetimidivorans TaxID=2818044 RepID=A0A8J8B0L5_9FIRM|nr:tRNA pseudouridine(55) synthase TruB [Sinanaerobacter chloroacetimidivorans]MBR0596756.1 tRNA pseudouridine(55) synthase TruB [Sinanaerobacter chloroacetimidivorans]
MIRDGIINLLKPAGMTSHDGVQILRRLSGIKRIGHTGTLDPMAVGVLPLCIGSAARITEYLDLDYKKYRCEMQLGLVTDTQDIWGTILSDHREDGKKFSEAEILEAFKPFRGQILQLPPNYSAVRVNGRRLYEYARQGETVEVKPRLVDIKSLSVIQMDLDSGRITFDVECSKGTYIRTICQDVGEQLGCGAVMSCLIRTASGIFTLENTVTLEELAEGPLDRYILDTDYPLVHFGRAAVSEERGKWFVNGGHLRMSEVKIEKEPEFKDSEQGLDIREEYKMAYNIYLDQPQGSKDVTNGFLGVAFYNKQYKKLVPDKIFLRQG